MFRAFPKTVAAAATIVLSLVLGAPAFAQQPAGQQEPIKPTIVENHGDWTFECSPVLANGGDFCTMQQLLSHTESKQVLLLMQVAYQLQTGKIVMAALTPLNVELPPGVGIKIDDGPQMAMPYANCNPRGCNAAVPLDDAIIEKLKSGNKIKVSYVLLGRRLDLDVSLKGFTAALKRVQEKKPAMSAAAAQ